MRETTEKPVYSCPHCLRRVVQIDRTADGKTYTHQDGTVCRQPGRTS